MTTEEKRDLLRACAEEHRFCTVRSLQEPDEHFLLPLRVEEEFYLSAAEAGMDTDGFAIERLSVTERVDPAGESSCRLYKILHLEEKIRVPDMDLSAPNRIFAWLASAGGAVYMECVHPGRQDVGLFTGVITDCTEETLDIRCFDTACHWSGGILTVPYDAVRRVMFGTKLLKSYEALLPPLPGRKR